MGLGLMGFRAGGFRVFGGVFEFQGLGLKL